jgi:polyisoprenyl-teichoic acid--peptidoglycan teichoic acid transferase
MEYPHDLPINLILVSWKNGRSPAMRKRWNLKKADRRAVYGISLTVIILLAIIIGIVSWVGQTLEKSNQSVVTHGDLGERFAEVPAVEYMGAFYRPYEKITSILMIGVDQYTTGTDQGISYRNGGQADYLLLLVINNETQTITPIQIDRDTMAEITILGVLGDKTGTRVVQICLSHGFGDGKEQSCLLTKQAVSGLLNGIDIDFYIAMDMDGIPALNDALDGITVTLEDDFTALDPTMVNGATLTLHGMQAEYFVRGRMNIGVGTNEARMVRQQVFMDVLTERISQRIHANGSAGFLSNLLDLLDPYLLTDMKRGRIINEAWNTRDYVRLDTVRPEGQYVIGTYGFNEFHADEAALEDLMMGIFYYPVETEPVP